MELEKKYKKFLLSKKSSFLSHAISKVHTTYSDVLNRDNFSWKILKKLVFFFDNGKLRIHKNINYKIIILSNIISIKEIKNDLYFGNLDKIFRKNKINSLKVYRNHTNHRSGKIRKFLKDKNSILLNKRLDILSEILIFYLFIKETLIFIFSDKYYLIKENLLLKDFLSIIPNLRLIYQVKKIIKIVKPKAIIFTFEGHAWERLLTYYCKNNDAKIVSIAYQFSILKKNQYGLFYNLKHDYNPDFIATSGTIPYQIIKEKNKNSNLIKLGSSKFIKPQKKTTKKIDLLVTLDTDYNKFKYLLDMLKKIISKNQSLKITLRPHPISKNDKIFMRDILKNINGFKNLSLSSKSLEIDLKNSRYLLFTDSAISITALNYNVIPLFFKYKNNINFFGKNFPKKNIIKNHIDLDKKINKGRDNLNYYFNNFRDNYFEKYKIKKIKNILDKL